MAHGNTKIVKDPMSNIMNLSQVSESHKTNKVTKRNGIEQKQIWKRRRNKVDNSHSRRTIAFVCLYLVGAAHRASGASRSLAV